MEIIIIICTLCLIFLRCAYIYMLIDDWNNSLDLHILKYKEKETKSKEYLIYIERCRLKAYKYYVRLDVWSINNIINDPFLVTDVMNTIQTRYKS